jgi:hypothetical protein
MTMTGRIGSYYWAELPPERAAVGDVVRALRSCLQGLTAVNVSWDSGQMQDTAPIPMGWSIRGNHVLSPPVDDAMLSSWPQSVCNSGRYDEWYFFRVIPETPQLQPFCNWQGVSLASAGDLAFPGGFDLAGQLETSQPVVVVGEGSALFVIAQDEATLRQLASVAP